MRVLLLDPYSPLVTVKCAVKSAQNRHTLFRTGEKITHKADCFKKDALRIFSFLPVPSPLWGDSTAPHNLPSVTHSVSLHPRRAGTFAGRTRQAFPTPAAAAAKHRPSYVVSGSFGGAVISLVEQCQCRFPCTGSHCKFCRNIWYAADLFEMLRLSPLVSVRFHPVIARAVDFRYFLLSFCFTWHSWSTFTILLLLFYTPLSKNNRNEC